MRSDHLDRSGTAERVVDMRDPFVAGDFLTNVIRGKSFDVGIPAVNGLIPVISESNTEIECALLRHWFPAEAFVGGRDSV
ncbi:hypothetical protein YW3DRAFT_06647 [Streptomyces sp. MnatMP-M77]|nr:hypothetical protein YW3DRAFT_06647 [Streptomyces sp. MnatMP-M77]